MVPDRHRKVLFVGWDAADWKVIHPLMDAGRMPHLRRLVDGGSMAQLATIHPPLSPMVWTSIATGKRPFKHGIHGFIEPRADGQGIQPITNRSRTCKAVWNIFNQNDLRSVVIGWWPSHPAEPIRGVTVSDHFHRAQVPIKDKTGPLSEIWPLPPNAIHPPELAATLAEVRFHPQELLPSMVKPFVPNVEKIDQDKDRRLEGLMKTIGECVSIHSAATWLLDNEPWDFFAVYYDAIDHFSHGFMRYRAPRQSWISEEDFEMYQHVVTEAYVFHDQMLGTLLEKARRTAGGDLTVMVVSDHGFHSGHLRPRVIPDFPTGPAIEHSDFGIFVVNGPGIRRDHLLFGANLLDVTPTLLTLYGLPVGADMDGKALTAAFDAPPDPRIIPSWEEVPGDDGRHPPDFQSDPLAANEAMEQMIALGYIERPDANAAKAIADTVAELRYNLGEAFQDADRHEDAAREFREIWEKNPDEQRYATHYFVSCQALRRIDEMRRVVEDLDGRRRALFEEAVPKVEALRETGMERLKAKAAEKGEPEPNPARSPDEKFEEFFSPEELKEFKHWRNLARFQPPTVDYLKSQLLTAEGKYEEALERLALVKSAHLARPGLLLQTGDLYRRLGRWEEARQTFLRAVAIDPDNPHAHIGLCRIALGRRDYEGAAEHALDCIRRLYHYPLAHFLLGAALEGNERPGAGDRRAADSDFAQSQFSAGAFAAGADVGAQRRRCRSWRGTSPYRARDPQGFAAASSAAAAARDSRRARFAGSEHGGRAAPGRIRNRGQRITAVGNFHADADAPCRRNAGAKRWRAYGRRRPSARIFRVRAGQANDARARMARGGHGQGRQNHRPAAYRAAGRCAVPRDCHRAGLRGDSRLASENDRAPRRKRARYAGTPRGSCRRIRPHHPSHAPLSRAPPSHLLSLAEA